MSLKTIPRIKSNSYFKKHTRAFLNKKLCKTAMVSTEVEVTVNQNTKTKKISVDLESSLVITDCYRRVQLDFSSYGETPAALKYKVDKLQEALDCIKQGIVEYEKVKGKLK